MNHRTTRRQRRALRPVVRVVHVKPIYRSVLSYLPTKHRTCLAFVLFFLMVGLYVYFELRFADKAAELIGGALIEHLLFGD